MNIRKKALKIIIITVLVLLVILLVMSRVLILNEFEEIEKNQLENDISLLQMILNQEIERINTINGDWAPWDDTYQFINDRNNKYIENNLGDETFKNLDLNFMVFIDSNNNLVYNKQADLHQQDEVSLNNGMLNYLLDKNSEIGFSDNSDYTAGVIIYQDQPYYISFRPILKSEFRGEQNGVLVMGKHLDSHFRSNLADSLNITVEIKVTDSDNKLESNYKKIPDSSILKDGISQINPINRKYIAGDLVVKDLSGDYRLRFRLIEARNVYAQGLKSLYYLLFVFLLSSALFSFVIFYLLNKTIFIYNDEQQVLLNTIPARIFLKDRDLNYMSANNVFLEEVDCTLAEIKGKSDYDILSKAEADTLRKWEKEVLDKGEDFSTHETMLQTSDGSKKWISASHGVYRDNSGKIKGLVGIIMDITEQYRLRAMAYQDYLTKLPNRAKFVEYFEELVAKDKKTFSIIYLDLDRFKLINDSFGHDAGDQFLKSIAEKMKDLVGPEDMVARFSGDEFAFVFVDLEDLEQIKQKCRSILKAIEEPWEYLDQEFQIKASAGIVNYPDDGEKISILLRNVDLAMYYAKENDLDFKVFTDNLSENFIEQLTMENDLRMAVEKNELEIYYQPLLTLDTGKIDTMEALLRWESPKQGFISPAKFIPLAEKSGLIIPIGKWVLRQACQQIKEWSISYNKEMRVAVNISTIQFEQLKFIDDVRSIINETGVDPRRLEFEITESVLMVEPELVLAKLNKLKELGIKISLDDFGTGYSSLSYLKKFPIDKLKIDRSFIMDLTVDNYETGIVKAILDLAKNMGLTVTAEGVETLAQLNLLKKLKCDKIQGYYISRPIPAAEFEQEFLKKE